MLFCIAVTIAIIACLILYRFYRNETTFEEYFALILPTIVFYFLFKLVFICTQTNDTEYLGSYIRNITYYEPWDEQVWVTKTRQVPDGEDENGHTKYKTETYQELEYRYHSDHYTYVDSESKYEHYISKGEYNMIKQQFNSTAVFKDMHRKYDKLDGDAYITSWDGQKEHAYTLTETHIYTNKVKASEHSVFNFKKLNPEDIKKYGLYDYPKIKDMNQNPIIGYNATKEEQDNFKYINGIYGKSKQIHVFIVIFNSDNKELANYQRSYWEGGNKNEFIVCLGVKNGIVKWCKPFSWQDSKLLEVKTETFFRHNKQLDLNAYADWLIDNIDLWKRKEFKDFDYIQITLTTSQITTIYILLIIYNLIASIVIINNDLKNDNDHFDYNRRYNYNQY